MRLLFFLPNISAYRDRTRLLMEVSRGLDRLILMVGQLDEDVDTTSYPNLRVVPVGFRRGNRPYNLARASWLAVRAIKNERISVVHDTFGTLLSLFFVKKPYPHVKFVESFYFLSGWRLRHVWNDVPTWKLFSNRSKAMLYPNAMVEQLACRFADNVVVQAPGLIDQLLEYTTIPRTKVSVLTNNVDSSYWNVGQDKPRHRPAKSPVRLLFIGSSIARTRGALHLIEAVRAARDRSISVALTMMGGKWEWFTREPVQTLINKYGLQEQIRVVDSRVAQAEVRSAFWNHDLFVYQTMNDGSPRVVLEALASGLPVIASHHPGIDVIDPTGEFIAFTNYGDVPHIVAWIQDYAQNHSAWQERAHLGHQRITGRFSTPVVARQYVSFYRDLVLRRTSVTRSE